MRTLEYPREAVAMKDPSIPDFYTRSAGSVGLGFENEADSFRFAAGNGHFLGLLAVGLVIGSDGVLARRQIGKLKAAVFAGNRVVGILQHREGAMHPGMDIAFHGDHFRLVIFVGDWRSAGRLRLIPLAVNFGKRMNVVG